MCLVCLLFVIAGMVFVSLLEGKAIVTSLRDCPQPGQNSKLYNVVRQLGNPFSDALIYYAAALNQTLAELCSQGRLWLLLGR